MVYGVVNKRTRKRIRLPTGKLTPVFNYPSEAQRYIDRILGSSQYCTIKKLGE